MKTITRCFLPALLAASTLAQADMAFKINDDGTLQRPEGYREWVYVGTPVTPNDMNDGKAPFPEFHNVYIDPESFAHCRTPDMRLLTN